MEDRPLVTPLDASPTPSKLNTKTVYIIAIFIAIIAGSFLGIFFASKNKSTTQLSQTTSSTNQVSTANEIGSTNPAFSDEATGQLQKGGLNGEGTHQLIRPGGASQTVYLVSSILDLDQFIGKNIQVFGQTLRAKSVGWLMDVGRVKILD